MSSVSRGNAFEDRVFSAISRELDAGTLGLSPKLAKAFKKKGYHSRDRDADIIIDVSVELWLPNSDRWSILWACECKDYSGTLPVSDVEEFKSKLDQIAGVNKKGVLATSGTLQSGALKYARAVGIGVIRLMPDDRVQHLIYHMTSMSHDAFELDPEEYYRALTDPRFRAVNRYFYAESNGYIFSDWHALLRASLKT